MLSYSFKKMYRAYNAISEFIFDQLTNFGDWLCRIPENLMLGTCAVTGSILKLIEKIDRWDRFMTANLQTKRREMKIALIHFWEKSKKHFYATVSFALISMTVTPWWILGVYPFAPAVVAMFIHDFAIMSGCLFGAGVFGYVIGMNIDSLRAMVSSIVRSVRLFPRNVSYWFKKFFGVSEQTIRLRQRKLIGAIWPEYQDVIEADQRNVKEENEFGGYTMYPYEVHPLFV